MIARLDIGGKTVYAILSGSSKDRRKSLRKLKRRFGEEKHIGAWGTQTIYLFKR